MKLITKTTQLYRKIGLKAFTFYYTAIYYNYWCYSVIDSVTINYN